MKQLMNISAGEFTKIASFVYDKMGIHLTEEKRTLVVGRLQKIIKDLNLSSFEEYYKYLLDDKTGKAIDVLANRISTNHTFFFRESKHYDFMKEKVLPEIVARKKAEGSNDIRIWCAAASTGEEPYCIIMTLMEFFGSDYKNWNAGLLGTDISAKALGVASAGVYDEERLQDVPVAMRTKYFDKLRDGDFKVKASLQKEATFRRFNLMNPLPFKENFDIIFCRNVMIYFDHKTKHELAEKMYQKTVDGGYLFIGHAESLSRKEISYNYAHPATYRKG